MSLHRTHSAGGWFTPNSDDERDMLVVDGGNEVTTMVVLTHNENGESTSLLQKVHRPFSLGGDDVKAGTEVSQVLVFPGECRHRECGCEIEINLN